MKRISGFPIYEVKAQFSSFQAIDHRMKSREPQIVRKTPHKKKDGFEPSRNSKGAQKNAGCF